MSSFAAFWLSRLALIAAAVFAYCGVRSLVLNPRGLANRLAALFNAVFVAWALGAVYWYATPDPLAAQRLYKAFSWCWCLFPPLVLHFCWLVSGMPRPRSRLGGAAALVLAYAPSLVLAAILPSRILSDPVWRGGYWMLTTERNLAYVAFVIHYFLWCLIALVAIFTGRSKSGSENRRARLRLIGVSSAVALGLGFVTDSVFLVAGVDFPNMAIFWILILSVGMLRAMGRFGFLSPIPPAEAPRILDALADFVVYVDDRARVVWANGSALRAMGDRDLDSLVGLPASAFLQASQAERLAATARGEEEGWEDKAEMLPSGIPVGLRVLPILGLGQARGAIVAAMDLRAEAAREKAESSLADSGLLLDEFVAHSRDGIILLDRRSRIRRWNEAAAVATGVSAGEAIGRQPLEVFGELASDRPGRENIARLFGPEAMEARAEGLEETVDASTPDIGIQRADGEERILQLGVFAIPLREGVVTAALVRDVTEERRSAARTIDRIRRLDHAQKMDAVGALTSGIAHDFNNTLAGLIGALSLIRLGIEQGSIRSPDDMRLELDIITRAADRAASSVRRLLALTKKRLPENLPFRLDEAMERVAAFAGSSLDPSVRLELTGLPVEALVTGDAGQVEQLLLNLLINASQAMTSMRPRGERRGGKIELGIQPFRPGPGFLAENPEAEDRDYWLLRVRDEGVGIPPEIASRVFEPFFSTKQGESSSGLGLAMVHSIARQHEGFVSLRSEPGRWTEFQVCLPRCDHAQDEDEGAALARGAGPVLVADDDEVPRSAASAMLAALGYEPRQAESGEEALALFAREPATWAAVLLDCRMGGMGGCEAARELRALRPDLPVIIATGYADEELGHAAPRGAVVLEKPYSVESLSRALAQAAEGLSRRG
jgi:PAS domain S-box-containing protein